MHIIFDYEKEIKLRSLAGQGEQIALLSHDLNFNNYLKEWDEMRKNTIMVNLQMKNLEIGSCRSLRNQDF